MIHLFIDYFQYFGNKLKYLNQLNLKYLIINKYILYQVIKCITKEYQYDDFFFGITAQSAFLTRFQIQPIKLKCFYHQSDVGQSFTYILQYNSTVEGVQDLVVRHTQKVNVEVVKTYFYEAEYYLLYSVGFLLGSVLLMGLGYVGYWFQSNQREHSILVEYIEKTAREKGIKQINGSTMQKGDETSVFQQQNKSILS